MRSISVAAGRLKALALTLSIGACRLLARACDRTASGLEKLVAPAKDAAATEAHRG